MINWLLQTTQAHPDLARGVPPAGLLGAEEAAHFATLTVPKRRRDWLLGRWTAKQLLRQMLWQQWGVQVALEQVQVLNGRTHAPHVQIDASISEDITPLLSISHANSHAFCAALLETHPPIGADMEEIAPRSTGFVQDYFTPAEQALVRQAAPPMVDTLVTAVWSGKEAVLKALQLGLTVDTRAVTCLIEPPTALPHVWTPFAITLDETRLPDARPLLGWWRVQDGFVLTLVI